MGRESEEIRKANEPNQGSMPQRLQAIIEGLFNIGINWDERMLPDQKVFIRKLDTIQTMLGEMANVLNDLHSGMRMGMVSKNGELDEIQAGSHIRNVYLSDLFPGVGKVELPIEVINEESGHANHVDLLYVNAIARAIQAERVFEFGTYLGRTTYYLTFSSPNAKVFTLNLPPEADPRIAPYLGSFFKGTDREDRIELILGDSRTFDTGPLAKSMDFIFVDGDHSYAAVKNDTAKAFELLKPGGTIVWHDYAAKSPGVVTFFKEFSAHTPVFRIKDTCLIVYVDGVNVDTFVPGPRRGSLVSSA